MVAIETFSGKSWARVRCCWRYGIHAHDSIEGLRPLLRQFRGCLLHARRNAPLVLVRNVNKLLVDSCSHGSLRIDGGQLRVQFLLICNELLVLCQGALALTCGPASRAACYFWSLRVGQALSEKLGEHHAGIRFRFVVRRRRWCSGLRWGGGGSLCRAKQRAASLRGVPCQWLWRWRWRWCWGFRCLLRMAHPTKRIPLQVNVARHEPPVLGLTGEVLQRIWHSERVRRGRWCWMWCRWRCGAVNSCASRTSATTTCRFTSHE